VVIALWSGCSHAEPGPETTADSANKPLWLAVCPEMFEQALAPLADHRRDDGMEVLISTDSPPEAVAACPRLPSYILLVGDVAPDAEGDSPPWHMPAERVRQHRWGPRQRETFPSDAILGDLDDDGRPEVPVGRLPVRSVEQLNAIIEKIIAYEQAEAELADLRLNFWAGDPAYGAALNTLATPAAITALRSAAPPWVQPWMLSSNPAFAFTGHPPDAPAIFCRRMAEGSLLNLLMGHGSETHWYSMVHEQETIWLSPQTARKSLSDGPPASPLIILACLCGSYDREAPSLAERLLDLPGGPVAVVAASAESHPLPNLYSGLAMLPVLDDRPERMGKLWLALLDRVRKQRNPIYEAVVNVEHDRQGLDVEIDDLLEDHPRLYNLFGDPATRLRMPQPLHGRLDFIDGAWQWRVDKPEEAERLIVEFRPAGRKPPMAVQDPTAEQAAALLEKANALFEFERLAEMTADEDWQGQIDEEGLLRLIAVGEGKTWTAGLRLNKPE
jgi:hypothetical protein